MVILLEEQEHWVAETEVHKNTVQCQVYVEVLLKDTDHICRITQRTD